jgi:LuxR family maltose regulon positive regulatory protein
MTETAQPAAIPDGLLRTKLAPPRSRAGGVARPDLLARLDAGLARRMTLVSAPAGFGKTTLLAEWAASRAPAPGQPGLLAAPAAWVTLDPGDDDPVRFWSYVLSACRGWGDAVGRQALGALRMAQQPAVEALLIPFINELAQLDGPRALVLEDFHQIGSPDVHASVAFLIEHLPGSVHVIVTSRGTPELPLARLRARDELAELTAADMRFSDAEARAFVEQALQVGLAPETLAAIQRRAEGWPAGLRLLALALRPGGAPAAEQIVAGFSGGHRHVVEYLVSEVLAAQPEPIQQFLLATCGLAKLTGDLCDAVTGRDDGAATLEWLDRENLFVSPLDAGGPGWYRYHPMFAEAMRLHAQRRLGADAAREQHERACAWYDVRGMLPDAVEEAIAAGAAERAATLIERFFERGAFNELYTLRRWVEHLPEASLAGHPLVCFAYAHALLFTLDRYAPATGRAVERWAQRAEDSWRAQGDRPRLGQVAALRAMAAFWQGDEPQTFAHARAALELLDEHDLLYRGTSLLYVAQERLLAGDADAAQRLGMEAYTCFEVFQNPHGTLAATTLLAEVCFMRGELDQADYHHQRVLDAAVGGAEMLDDQGFALLGLGRGSYERGDLAGAEERLARGAELGAQRHAEQLEAQAGIGLAQIWHAVGQPARAGAHLRSLATRVRSPALLREIQGWQARLALAAGDLEAAERWHAGLAELGEPPHLQQEHEALTIARWHLARGEPQAALGPLERWCADATACGRTRAEVETLALLGLAHSALGDQTAAAHALGRALALGQPRGLRRVFLDLGAPLEAPLRAAAKSLSRRAVAAYAAELLRALVAGPGAATPVGEPALAEPLSQQERRVLRMIVAGQSNTEIARELVVSPNTIKTHVKSIYRKLGVSTRAEAQAAARELHLI